MTKLLPVLLPGLILQVSFSIVSSSGVMSIMGTELSSCSQPGTAMTGFTRDGRCADVGSADAGAHHVCIKMKSDFCTVTGQPNWCGESMSCMGQSGVCPIGNWCVCQWAFARYIHMAGGCDAIVNIVCDSTNMAALKAYKSQSSDPTIHAALQCLEKRCSLPISQLLYDADIPEIKQLNSPPSQSNTFMMVSCAGMFALVMFVGLYVLPSIRARIVSDLGEFAPTTLELESGSVE